jgi:hypothetical protein
MPKGNELYPARIDFFVSAEMRMQIIAIAYLMGSKGKHSVAARKMLTLGIELYLKSLSARKRTEYDFILSRVRILEDPKGLEEKDRELV